MRKFKETLNRRFFCLLDFGDRLLRGLTGGKSLTGGPIYKSDVRYLRETTAMAPFSPFSHSPLVGALERYLQGWPFHFRTGYQIPEIR